jgi:cytochrome c oxidase subunit 2
VKRRVLVRLLSSDVIHSFWVPNLNGKRDLIPGRVNSMVIEADRPGEFRGQCAEYCGAQHANMALLVIAEDEAKFDAWRLRQVNSAREPTDAQQQRGRDVFLATSCVMCHTIRGTGAYGQNAPDLTHMAARHYLAAGALPNSAGSLAGWIVNSQSIKPGNHMPPVPLAPDDLQALLAYLTSLQ